MKPEHLGTILFCTMRKRDFFMVGEQISHYKVLEKIGEGGMGEVYLTSISHFGITLRRLFQLW